MSAELPNLDNLEEQRKRQEAAHQAEADARGQERMRQIKVDLKESPHKPGEARIEVALPSAGIDEVNFSRLSDSEAEELYRQLGKTLGKTEG